MTRSPQKASHNVARQCYERIRLALFSVIQLYLHRQKAVTVHLRHQNIGKRRGSYPHREDSMIISIR